MKPYEKFVENMLNAVRAGQGRDPAAVTALIHDTLRNAGLMPGVAAQAPQPASPPPSQPQPQPAPAAPFVDLNGVPAWARTQGGQAVKGKFGDWAARFKPQKTGGGAGNFARAPAATSGAPGEFLAGSFTTTAGTRRYRLYVPARPASGPRPLIVMLHGCTQNAADFAAGTAMNRLGEEHDCLVLYPDQERSANSNNCWNWFDAGHQGRDAGEPAIIADMTRQIIAEQGADPQRVYVAGLSAGGAMAAVLGAAYPELYAAVGVHSGLPVGAARDLMSALNAMKGARAGKPLAAVRRRTPLIVFHGDQDHTVHQSNGAAVFRQFTQATQDGGAALREIEAGGGQGSGQGSGRSFTRTTALDANDRAVAEYWVVHGAGHAWAGGDPSGSYVDASGPDASAEMVRFFLAQR
jgi:poly(hydroxyalkanoate) depolymerase family esterase